MQAQQAGTPPQEHTALPQQEPSRPVCNNVPSCDGRNGTEEGKVGLNYIYIYNVCVCVCVCVCVYFDYSIDSCFYTRVYGFLKT